MKKNVLALSIATIVGGLGFVGAANAALKISDSGAGHILLVPYYSAQNGNMSVFHVTNTDMTNGKAVKVRFRGASNSDDVLDFQVFLSPGDVWTAAVTKSADGIAQLTTHDNSCTLPSLTAGVPVPFVTDRLDRKDWTEADKAEQTLEGYVEILTMADVVKGSSLYAATKHNASGVASCDAETLKATLDDALETKLGDDKIRLSTTKDTEEEDLQTPTGGLVGQWYVMNVEKTTTFSGETPAIVANGTTKNVFSPQKVGKATKLETADPLMVSGAIEPQHYDVPDLSTPYEDGTANAAEQAKALTDQLLKTAVINQYATDAGISAKTDWLFSMPTRRYTIAANYSVEVPVGAAKIKAGVEATDKDATSISPKPLLTAAPYRVINTNVTGNAFAAPENTTVNPAGQICIDSVSNLFLDRSERQPLNPNEAVFSPGKPNSPNVLQLCGEVSVLAFSTDESALGAKLARQSVKASYVNGWGTVTFHKDGIPLLGSAFIKLSNPEAAPGTSGTYGLTWGHALTPVVTP